MSQHCAGVAVICLGVPIQVRSLMPHLWCLDLAVSFLGDVLSFFNFENELGDRGVLS